jgi:hypothetical protein
VKGEELRGKGSKTPGLARQMRNRHILAGAGSFTQNGKTQP